jgi:hypothetical protein
MPNLAIWIVNLLHRFTCQFVYKSVRPMLYVYLEIQSSKPSGWGIPRLAPPPSANLKQQCKCPGT